MPFLTDQGGLLPSGVPVPDVPNPTIGETVAASARSENTLVNLYRRLREESFPPDPNHNPYDIIRGTDYEAYHAPKFVASQSEGETRQIMRRIDQEEADRRTRAASGAAGFVADLVFGNADPTLALPAGILVRNAKLGYSVSRTALSVGSAAAAQVALQEGILQSTQETRSGKETALAVGSAAVIASVLGGGLAKFATRAELKGLERMVDADRLVMDAHATGQPVPAGAAATDTRNLTMTDLPGMSFRNPLTRTFGARSVEGKRTMADMAESPYRFHNNESGVATTQGPAVERLARMEIEGARVSVADELDRQFSEYRFGAPETSIPRARAVLQDWTGRAEGKMTFSDFKKEVSIAMHNGDQHDIPQVQAAAQFIRQRVFNPWGDRAGEAIEGFEKGAQAEGESYFPHSWNREKIARNKSQFTDYVAEKYTADQEVKRAAQQRIEWHYAQLKSWDSQVSKYQGMLERLQQKQALLGAKLDERAMEAKRAGDRSDVLTERSMSIAEEVTDISEFITAMRQEVKDPALLARLEDMERDVAIIRRLDRPVTEANLRQVEEEELQGILTGTNRMAAEMLTGRRKYPKAPSFVSWIVANGGIKDFPGDVATAIGGPRQRPGLINKQGRALDELGEKIQNEFPEAFPARDETGGGAPTHVQILEWIDNAMRGHEPDWWVQRFAEGDSKALEAGRIADVFDEIFTRAGVTVKNVRDVAKLMRDGRVGDVTLADLDKIAADMESVGQAIPLSVKRAAAEEELFAARQTVQEVRGLIRKAMDAQAAKERRLRIADERGKEAGIAERANVGRLGVLEERLSAAERRQELITDAIEIAKKHSDDVRAKLEEEIGNWQGTSANEAKSSLKAREKYAADTGRAPDAPRLESADTSVDRVIKRILESDRQLSPDEIRNIAEQTVDRILGSPDGRLPYDFHTGGPRIGFHEGPPQRGALAGRKFQVSNKWAREWIEDDIEHVVAMHLRTVIPDVLLSERFGDVEMQQAFRKINDDYARLSKQAKSEKESKAIENERKQVIKDVADVRDRIRGVYGWSPDLRNMARVANAAKSLNNFTSMGVSALSSLSDLAGIVFRYGMTSAFGEGWVPFFKGISTQSEEWSKFRSQMRAIGIGVETAINSRQHALDDVMDVYRPQSRLERTLQWTSDKFFIANLLAPLTDTQKLIASHVVVSEVLKATKAVAEGNGTSKQIANLAESGIDAQMASRIWQEFSRAGSVENGVHLPNTWDWESRAAADALNGAVAREVDIAVVTPGQDKPLWMSKPAISLLGQFKSFTASATERILVANMQRRDAATLSGLVFSIGLGMLSYKVNSFFGGQKTSDRPQDWIREGISRAGILGWFEEGNALASKATRGGADIYRLIGSNRPLSRYASRSTADMLLGPTMGKLENLRQVTGAAAGGDWTASDTSALRRLLPFQNLFYVRGLLNQVEESANAHAGIEPKPQR